MKVILHIDGVIKLETPSEGYVSDVILESHPIRIEVDHAKIIESLTAYLEPKVFMGIEVQADKLRKTAIDYERKAKCNQAAADELEAFLGYCDTELSGPDDETEENDEDRIENQRRHYS